MKSIKIMRLITLISLFFLVPTASANQLRLDTSFLYGEEAIISFELINGVPDVSSKIKIEASQVDGISFGPTGFLEDTGFYNTFDQQVTLGNELVLTFDLVAGATPVPGFFPDSFAIFLLDTTSYFPLFQTTDPTGADSLLQWDIGTDSPSVFVVGNYTQSSSNSIPEPPTLFLFFTALLALCFARKTHRISTFIISGLFFAYPAIANADPNLASVTDLGTQVEITASGLRLNRQTNTFDSVLTIVNTSQNEIKEPFTIAVLSLPEGVVLTNATTMSDEGIPLISWEGDGVLSPGSKISTVLKFQNSTNQVFPIAFRFIRLEQPIPDIELLQGSDTNNNGVRDDLESIIDSRYTGEAERKAAIQVVRSIRNSLAAMGSVESAFNATLLLNKSFDCMYNVFESEQARSEISFLTNEMMNNEERLTAWIALADLLAGQSAPVGVPNACE